MKKFVKKWLLVGLLLITGTAAAADRPPNFVLIFCDDLGYADLGCYGAKEQVTPHLDRLAREGVRFTDFYTAAAVCSASRAALLTGCYPQRVGILGALGPNDKHGIHEDEVLLPELLKAQGYTTAIFGKWHLGHHPKFLPTKHGFDRFFGLPYSNDMWPKHPESPQAYPDLPLIDGAKTIELNPDQTELTTWYTDRVVNFIREAKDKPFFLYVPHSMPHVPLFVSEKFRGKTNGTYGDVIAEIDWSIGQIMAALKETGNDENTLVLFTSDNGPWLSYGEHSGSAGPLREGKGTTWEGGHRVPCLARFPKVIPAGATCREVAGTIDVLPTFAKFAGAEAPTDRIMDGRDIGPLLRGEAGAKSPHEAFYFYWNQGLEAVRSEKWKLHFSHAYRSLDGKPGGKDGIPAKYVQKKTDAALYNLETDVGETTDVAAQHPDVVARLKELADKMRADLGDSLTNQSGKNRRPAGKQ